MTHKCPGPECTNDVPQRQLACGHCWDKVPKPLQQAVYRAWNRGAGAGSVEHRAAMQAAIRAMNRDE